jgi:ribonuclease P protein component
MHAAPALRLFSTCPLARLGNRPSDVLPATAHSMTSTSRSDLRPAPQSSTAGRTSPIQRPIRTSLQSLTESRLKKHADYQRAYAGSRKRQSPSMSWFMARQTPAYAGAPLPSGPRVGLTVGKVIGKAHERNRIKRRMRECLRRHVELLPQGFDLILHPRRFVMTIEFAKLDAEIVRILNQARADAHQSHTEAARKSQQAASL